MLRITAAWGEEENLAAPAAQAWWGVTGRELRDAFGAFATGVTVVTAQGWQGPVGLTVNSFAAVSLDPPLVLVCIDRRNRSLPAFERAEHFAINVLAAHQRTVADAFARPGEDQFLAGDWAPGVLGAPVLDGAAAALECRRHAIHDGGDHRIFVGRVEAMHAEPSAEPLLVARGRYRSLSPGD